MNKCVFAGTFDPVTNGHKQIIDTCLKMFDKVTVAVMVNTAKTPLLTISQRETLIKKIYKDNPSIKVIVSGKTIADVLDEEYTPFYVRGIRGYVDFEYETQNLYATQDINSKAIGVFIPSKQNSTHVSSTLVRNCIAFGKDYLDYLPSEIWEDIQGIVDGRTNG